MTIWLQMVFMKVVRLLIRSFMVYRPTALGQVRSDRSSTVLGVPLEKAKSRRRMPLRGTLRCINVLLTVLIRGTPLRLSNCVETKDSVRVDGSFLLPLRFVCVLPTARVCRLTWSPVLAPRNPRCRAVGLRSTLTILLLCTVTPWRLP